MSLNVWLCCRLEPLQSINVRSPITALALTESDSHIMLGLKDGKLLLVTVSF